MNKTVTLLIVVLLVVVLGAGGAIGYLMMNNQNQEVKTYIYAPASSFITNVRDSKALVKTTMSIQVTNKKAVEELEEKSTQVNDVINRILRQKSIDEMMSYEIQDILATEICRQIMDDTGINGLDTVYFSEFVVQQ